MSGVKTGSTLRLAAAAAVLAVTALEAPALAAGPTAQPVRSLASVIEAIPAWARDVLPAKLESPDALVQFSVLLKGRHPAALRRFDAAVSDPTSASYRHFLTRAEFARRFGPAPAETAAARTWLRHAGFTIDNTTPGGTLITAHATSALVGKVFATTFGLFDVAGRLLRAPLSQPTMPTALRPLAATVVGLAQTPAVSDASPPTGYINAHPCSRYYGQKVASTLPSYQGRHAPYAVCGYTMGQIRSAYGVNQVHSTGRGVTVGIVDAYASPTVESDVDTWSQRMGLPRLRPGQLTQHTFPGESSLPELSLLGVPILDGQGWAGEETLDIEAVHGMAPDASIAYYSAVANLPYEEVAGIGVGVDNLLLALAQAVESGKVDLVSNSWGDDSEDTVLGDVQVLNAITNEAAAEGVTIAFSSGDDGDELALTGHRVADFPTTSPGVVTVGGTTLQIGRTGARVSESYWGTQKIPFTKGKWDYQHKVYMYGGGGGDSTIFREPAWQYGIVPADEATYGGLMQPGRVEPDVSMVADPTTGIALGLTQSFADGATRYGEYRIGGTSLASPLFTGLLALADAEAHHRLGLVTPTMYADSRTAAQRQRLFYDPVPVAKRGALTRLADVRPDYTTGDNPKSAVIYTLRTIGVLGTLQALPGYDDSTGLGTPNAPALVAALA